MRSRKKTLELIEEMDRKGKVFNGVEDAIFKSIMQDEELKDYVSFIISSVNKRKIDKNTLLFVNTEGTKKTVIDRINVQDVVIEINKNRIGLEMNSSDNNRLRERNRAHFYEGVMKSINLSYIDGENRYYEQINFDSISSLGSIIEEYKMLNVKTGMVDKYEENFVRYHINMEKIYDKYYNYGKEKLTRFEKGILILKLNDKKELREISKGDEMLMRVEKKIEELSKNPDAVNYIDIEKAMEYGHKKDIKEAHDSGFEEGHSSGFNEGHSSGFEEGREKNKIGIAKKLLQKKMNIKDIIEITDLSKEQIDDLK